jgi:hypothetical protein
MAQTPKTNASQQKSAKDAVALLKADHRKVEGLFNQYESAGSNQEKEQLAHQISKELIVHAMIEEELFYPACREKGAEDLVDHAQVEHDELKVLVGELIEGSPHDKFYDAKVKVLFEDVKRHVAEEEDPANGLFAKAQKSGVDLVGLGEKLQFKKQMLVRDLDEKHLKPPVPKSIHLKASAHDGGVRDRHG